MEFGAERAEDRMKMNGKENRIETGHRVAFRGKGDVRIRWCAPVQKSDDDSHGRWQKRRRDRLNGVGVDEASVIGVRRSERDPRIGDGRRADDAEVAESRPVNRHDRSARDRARIGADRGDHRLGKDRGCEQQQCRHESQVHVSGLRTSSLIRRHTGTRLPGAVTLA